MKIIHCADLHLDSRMTSILSASEARERRADLLKTFMNMVRSASESSVKAILISGDLFDSERISANARNTVFETILTHPGILFFYLTGNHERDGFLNRLSRRPDNLLTFGPGWKTYTIRVDRAGRPHAEPAGEDDPAGGRITISGLELNEANAPVAAAGLRLSPKDFNIVMLHGQVADYPVKGRPEIIGLHQYANRNIDYLALGHVHRYHQDVLPPGGAWCYPGCLEGRGFDECGEHGYVLLEIEDRSDSRQQEVPEPNSRKPSGSGFVLNGSFVPVPQRHFHEEPVDITDCASTPAIISKIERQLDFPAGDLVKAILTGTPDVSGEKNLVQIQNYFNARFFVFRLEDQTRPAVDYNAYALDASLKGEFVRTVEEDPDLPEERKAEIIRCGILALAGEDTDL
ncbi:metallophosphoesterase family protein [Bilifractor sp. LCP21S3_A7]|uniref:metallophosphoesterase family protein n=1 Tax=Bilifractor sp. LCP21S3_A7 TaxID=3438738 RepID=UPI003F92F6CB